MREDQGKRVGDNPLHLREGREICGLSKRGPGLMVRRMDSQDQPLSPPHSLGVAWTTAVLVCRDCFERTDGPTCGGDGGTVKAKIKQALRDLKPLVRTLETSCLDCCPEKAFAVAIVAPDAAPRGFALTSLKQADEIVKIVRQSHLKQ